MADALEVDEARAAEQLIIQQPDRVEAIETAEIDVGESEEPTPVLARVEVENVEVDAAERPAKIIAADDFSPLEIDKNEEEIDWPNLGGGPAAVIFPTAELEGGPVGAGLRSGTP